MGILWVALVFHCERTFEQELSALRKLKGGQSSYNNNIVDENLSAKECLAYGVVAEKKYASHFSVELIFSNENVLQGDEI